MTRSKHHLGAKYSHEEYQEVLFLYKHFNIEKEPTSDALRKLHHAMYSLLIEQQHPSGSSRTQEQVRLLEGWDCPCRFPIWRFHKPSKQWHRKVLCSNPTTQQILRTTELDAEVCKRCYDTGGSANLPALPEPKQQVSKATPKRQPEPVKERDHAECANPNCDNVIYRGCVKRYPNWLPEFCSQCDKIRKGSGFQGWNQPFQGVPIGFDFNGKLKVEEKPREPQFDSHGNELSDAEISARFHETNGTRQSHEKWDAERAQKEHDKLSDEIQKELEQQSKEE